MSSACIRVASITVAVIIARLMTPLLAGVPAISGPEDRGHVAPQLAERALMTGIDRDLDAHAGAQREAVRDLAEGKANRYALHDLDPVAGSILRRQQGEDRSARRGQCRYLAGDGRFAIGVDGEARRITFPHIGEISLPDVGLDV